MTYSSAFKETINSTGAPESPVLLLEITHPDLPSTARIANDTQDITSNGNLFPAAPFRAQLPDDLSEGQPRAQLVVDNVGRELTQWIEDSGGGKDAQVRMMLVLRSNPDPIEWEITMTLNNVVMNMSEVSGTLGFDDLINMPGVLVQYRPETAPGLF